MINIETKCRDCQAPIKLNGIVISSTNVDFSQVKSTQCTKCGCRWVSVHITKGHTNMTEQDLIEELASHLSLVRRRVINHTLSKCKIIPYEGINNASIFATRDMIIPAKVVDQLQHIIETPYDNLSEQEKNEARHHVISTIMPIINKYIDEKLKEQKD